MHCVFCHNFEATQQGEGLDCDVEGLAQIMSELAESACSNIHLISPTHYAPQIADALSAVRRQGLSLPVIYNCSGYESVAMLERLEGLVDVYLPDFKFGPGDEGAELAGAPNYFDVALDAIAEMKRQVGPLELRNDGLATRGVAVRHLVMPGRAASSESILRALKGRLGSDVTLHLMSSYHPAFQSFERPDLSNATSPTEYDCVVRSARGLGFEDLIVD
jgi:putative pyruvate formate lyase activating enzyme